MDIYVIRHGRTVWNNEIRMQGRLNSPLTPEGIEGAAEISSTVTSLPIRKVLVSPMPRALQTSYLATKGKFPTQIEPMLSEMDLGDLEGMLRSEAEVLYPENYSYFRYEPHKFVPIGNGESYQDVFLRVKRLLTKLLNNEEGPLLLVTHMILVQSLLCVIENRELPTLRSTPFIEQAKLFHIRIEEKGARSYSARILLYNGEPCDRTFEFTL